MTHPLYTLAMVGLALALGLPVGVLPSGVARAATVSRLDVTHDGDCYHAVTRAHLDANPRAVHAALIDVSHFTYFSSSVVRAKLLRRLGPRSTLIDVEARGCIAIFCRTVKQRQVLIDVSPGRVIAVTQPGGSNVRRAHSEWRLTPEEGGTRLDWISTIEPDFWVPPLIGPALIRNELKNQGRRFVEGVEAYARSHPVPAATP